MKRYWQLWVFSLLMLVMGPARADWVWSDADTSGGGAGGWTLQTDPSTLNLIGTGTGIYGETGTSYASASLDDGYLKASVTTTSVFVPQGTSGGFTQPGQANLRVGLGATIELSGPQDVGGVVAVTMTFDGTYGSPENASLLQIASGPGVDGQLGFATSDTALRGDFGITDSAFYGQALQFCYNCTYTFGDDFLISVTAYLPFDAGDTSVFYAAQITMGTQGGFIDGSHTAVFSIDVPEGFTYSSALRFTEPVGPSIPEPGTLGLLAAALGAGAASRRATRISHQS